MLHYHQPLMMVNAMCKMLIDHIAWKRNYRSMRIILLIRRARWWRRTRLVCAHHLCRGGALCAVAAPGWCVVRGRAFCGEVVRGARSRRPPGAPWNPIWVVEKPFFFL